VLIMQALSGNSIHLTNISEANDSQLLQQLLKEIHQSNTKEITLDAQDAGTVFRFLTSYLCSQKGSFILTGSSRMQERPIGVLVNALKQLGADITYLKKEGYPPLQIHGTNLSSQNIQIDAHISSQFITSILLISPYLPQGIEIELNQKVNSLPYIDMTIKLMQEFGIKIIRNNQFINVSPGNYQDKILSIEADWSSAAFWYQCVAFSKNSRLLLKGLTLDSIQGDSVIPQIFEQLSVKTTSTDKGVLIENSNHINYNLSFDFSNYPDIAMSVINTCAGLGVIGKFSGLASLKIKESNRIQALEIELEKLGFDFRETDEDEWVLINSCKVSDAEYDFSEINIETYKDHRLAMSFAPFAILGKGINIENPQVVSKSYPNFWLELEKLQ